MKVKDVLDREFRLLAARRDQLKPLMKNKERSKFLGISEAQLSRICNGKSSLTDAKVLRFVTALRQNADDRDSLAGDLHLAAKSIVREQNFDSRRALSEPEISSLYREGSLENVSELFRRIGRPRGFLAVEYRDLPRSSSNAKHTSYAKELGKAIAKGLHFAMFQPFGSGFISTDGREHHTWEVRAYLETLSKSVRDVRDAILGYALDAVGEDSIDNMKLSRQEREEVSSRIVLYERPIRVPFTGSGIQSRMFYVEIPTEGRTEHEVWEWIAGAKRDFFVQRDLAESIRRDAAFEQFFPVTQFWREHAKLPATNRELSEAAKRGKALGAKIRTKAPWWEIAT